MQPLVSVLIPSYNHEKYVQETIRSVINQTYPNIELIVIDDGSTDSTYSKIQEMEAECKQRFVNFHYETKQNEGTCVTFNKLIMQSRGEYIYIIASDDTAKPMAIEKEVDFLSSNPDYALVVGDNEFIDSESRKCYWDTDRNLVYNHEEAVYLSFKPFLEKRSNIDFCSENFGSYETLRYRNYIPNGYLIRKSIFDKTGLYTKEAPLEDYYIMLQISKYAKMKFLNEILFSYRWHENNSIKNRDKMIADFMQTKEFDKEVLAGISIVDASVLDSAKIYKYNLAERQIASLNTRLDKTKARLENTKERLESLKQHHQFQKERSERLKIKLEDARAENKTLSSQNQSMKKQLSYMVSKSKIFRKYLKYKIFSKIFFGSKKEYYIEKAQKYHEMVREIRKVTEEYKSL